MLYSTDGTNKKTVDSLAKTWLHFYARIMVIPNTEPVHVNSLHVSDHMKRSFPYKPIDLQDPTLT